MVNIKEIVSDVETWSREDLINFTIDRLFEEALLQEPSIFQEPVRLKDTKLG